MVDGSDGESGPSLPYETSITVEYDLNPKDNTVRTQRVKDAYGIDFDAGTIRPVDDVSVRVGPGQVIFATGSSGAGKTSFCRRLADELGAVSFNDVEMPRDIPLIESFPSELSVPETQLAMSMFGLAEAHLNLRTYDELSDGQQYRAKLAYCSTRFDRVFADEYCATLDRETARTISYSIRKQLLKGRLTGVFIFATTHRDILPDLQPDWLLDFDRNELVEGHPVDSAVSVDDYLSRSEVRDELNDSPKPLTRRDREEVGKLNTMLDEMEKRRG